MDTEGLVEQLLALADQSWPELGAPITADEVARVVLDEVRSRAALFAGPQAPVAAQFDLGYEDARLGYTLTVGGGTPSLQPGWAREAPVVIRQDLVELLHSLYGRYGGRRAVTRELSVRNEPGPETDEPDDPWFGQRRDWVLAAGQLVRACSPYQDDLDSLALAFGSDKWGEHWYAEHYDRHLARFRDQRVRVLEIGVGGFADPMAGGESLRMWKHYFWRGQIYGLDVFDKRSLDEQRITTIRGDQSDVESLGAAADRIGPLDIVIDDGSHQSSHVTKSFDVLFPRLRPGGLYVIEDLQTSYWPGWNGGYADLNEPATSVGFLKTLIDGLHHQDQLHDPPRMSSSVDRTVAALHFYHNIVFIEKGLNSEGTAPSWVRRYRNDMDLEPKGSMRRLSTPELRS